MGLAVCLVLTAFLIVSHAGEFISPGEIEAGMQGYGLTVFRGTEPETFVVEAVGVLKNRLPKQDLVVILMEDPKLLESNIVAGMSGSPIYFGGRLLGALAYGPVFSKKPIAYVTPIENMLKELDRPAEPERTWQRVSALRDFMGRDAAGRGMDESSGVPSRAGPGASGVKPVSSILSVSGFSPGRLNLLEEWFSPYGLIPVASGGADPSRGAGPSAYVPGGAIGVQLMSGDLSMTAIGTVTHVSPGGRVLAFGHPFFNIGQTAMPATTAHVHMFVPSTYISYKLASPIRTLGSMVQDRQPAILIDSNRTAQMVPVRVEVSNEVTGREETYRYEVIREQRLTPLLAFIGLMEALDAAEAGPPGDRAFTVRSEMRVAGREKAVTLEDLTPSPYKTLFEILMLLDNRIEEAVPRSFDFSVKVANASRIAWITSVRTTSKKFQPGARVPVTVRLRTQQGEERRLTAGFTLPPSLQGRVADFEIRGGFGFQQPEAPPRTLDQVVRILERRPKGNDLVIRLLQTPPSQTQDGEALPNLPNFFQRLTQGGVQGMSPMVMQPAYETFGTEWIVYGAQRLQVEIESEGKAR